MKIMKVLSERVNNMNLWHFRILLSRWKYLEHY